MDTYGYQCCQGAALFVVRVAFKFRHTLILLLNKDFLNHYRPQARCLEYNSRKKVIVKDFMLLRGTQALNN